MCMEKMFEKPLDAVFRSPYTLNSAKTCLYEAFKCIFYEFLRNFTANKRQE